MQITDVVLGLAAGVGIDLSPDGKTAFYVEWSIGDLSKVEVKTGMVSSVLRNLEYPEDVEVDWQTGDMFISEPTGAIVRVWAGGDRHEKIAQPGGAPQQLDLKKSSGKRFLYTVCYDSGRLVRIEVDTGTVTTIASGLGHPVGVVVEAGQQFAYVTEQD